MRGRQRDQLGRFVAHQNQLPQVDMADAANPAPVQQPNDILPPVLAPPLPIPIVPPVQPIVLPPQPQVFPQLPVIFNMPVINPTTFSGDGNVREWLGHFDRAAIANGWDELRKVDVLPAFLSGKAAKFWSNLNPRPVNIGELRVVLEAEFTVPNEPDKLHTELLQKFQLGTESVDQFASEIRRLVTGANPNLNAADLDVALVREFKHRCRPDVGRTIAMFYPPPRDFNAVVAIGKTAEAAAQFDSHVRAKPTVTPCVGSVTVQPAAQSSTDIARLVEEAVVARLSSLGIGLSDQSMSVSRAVVPQLRPQYQQPRYPPPFPPQSQGYGYQPPQMFQRFNQPRGQWSCYRCGEPGHIARQCQSERTVQSNPRPVQPNQTGKGPQNWNQGN